MIAADNVAFGMSYWEVMMKLGLVGLPNVGKSTLFNAITNAGALVANYPFATIEKNIGIVPVPDRRLLNLGEMYHPRKIVPATLELVDIAGLVAGASRGEGLGNAFLADIREVDAILHVVRCFSDPNITHVAGSVDPARDIGVINTELIFADLAYTERRIEKTARMAKSGDKKIEADLDWLKGLEAHLSNGRFARSYEYFDDQKPESLHLLTAKPLLYIANVSEDDLGAESDALKIVREIACADLAPVLPISAAIEADIRLLDDTEQKDFRHELGMEVTGLDAIVREGYALLGLVSFLTVGEDEVRAWTIRRGTKAPEAAGKIHSDFERGFIRAEVIAFDDLVAAGSMVRARELGKIRSEGKEYIIKDGDVVLFRFNV